MVLLREIVRKLQLALALLAVMQFFAHEHPMMNFKFPKTIAPASAKET